MQEPTLWFGRSFELGLDNRYFPNILERLKGTPARLEEKIQSIPEEQHGIKFKEKWSIQEQVGHLLDLEPLWYGRIADILNGKNELREADLTNAKTDQADHNQASMSELLQAFRKDRSSLVSALMAVDQEVLEREALHPRLKQPMRIIDLAFFVAEHDDHHLAYITWIRNHLAG